MPSVRSGHANDAWWTVDQAAAVPAVRRAAANLATEAGFTAERVAEVGIVASELATNLVRHAGGGEMVLRGSREGGVRLVAIDSGPGSRDINALIADGASTGGTLGIGLGACRRLSSAFDVYSVPAVGTVAEALLHPPNGTEKTAGSTFAGLTRPLSGQGPCGDTTAHRVTRGVHLAMVADGLGHGPLAAEASRRAAEVLMASDSTSPAAVLERIHTALQGTRGAAVSIIGHDPSAGTVTHAGIGNVVARVVGASGIRTLPSQPGIVGHRAPRPREQTVPAGQDGVAVLHSDGLTQRWTLDDLPGVLSHRPAVVCGALLRAAASRRDDAGVLVLRVAA